MVFRIAPLPVVAVIAFFFLLAVAVPVLVWRGRVFGANSHCHVYLTPYYCTFIGNRSSKALKVEHDTHLSLPRKG